MAMPEVAVIITCYNYGKYIKQAVLSAIGQDVPVEVIVIDDGSTDISTLEVLDNIRKEGVLIHRQPNRGLPGARNSGVKLAQAKYVVCLDADDIIHKRYCSTCLEVLKSRTDIGFVYTTTKVFGHKNKLWSNITFSKLHLLLDNYIPYSAMFRRELWENIGGFDENMRFGYEDWDFWLAAVEKGWSGFHVPENLFLYRKHGESMLSSSNRCRKELKNYLRRKHKGLYSPGGILKLLKEEPFHIPRALGALLKEEVLRTLVRGKI